MARRTTQDDTRRFRRRTIRTLVDYASDLGVGCDYATTLGAGGLFIETESALPSGTRLKMRFRLPGSETLHELSGRVAWHRGPDVAQAVHSPGMGIQFTDEVGQAALARELEKLP
jgi:uncharacterized protein (TIGR02266 family)